MPSVRGLGAAEGWVPAEMARHPIAGFQLNIASAIRDRQAFSTQMSRTAFSSVYPPFLGLTARISAGTTPREAWPRRESGTFSGIFRSR